MTAMLDAIDATLAAYDDHKGSPWPGRTPTTDELLEALFGAEDGTRVPSLAWLYDDLRSGDVGRMLGSCGCAGDHEPVLKLGWGTPRAVSSLILASTFATQRNGSWPSWLAEEDAWLADRATREAATR